MLKRFLGFLQYFILQYWQNQFWVWRIFLVAFEGNSLRAYEEISVADPDPHVFGPPGSGSTSQRYGSGSGSFYHHAKIVRKNLIPTIL
jgi:hypothetical protein